MSALTDILQGERIGRHRPWPRCVVTPENWRKIAGELAAGRAALLGLWGDPDAVVHMALLDETAKSIAVASVVCADGTFPSVGAVHPPAIKFERAIHSLYGLVPAGAPDIRPWIDLGFWAVQFPLGARLRAPAEKPAYAFLPVEGEALHQVAVGPIHAGIIEPGHFRFTAGGETIVRLEQRLGYVHKGIESLMAGATIEAAARLAARASGDSTVAYGIAFARAVEAARSAEAPPRAHALRALMAELERLANHFGDVGAICNDASFPIMHAHCGVLRELILRAADHCFGHRLMMDRAIPGGVAGDLSPAGIGLIRAALQDTSQRFARLVELYDNTASLQDRTVGAGIVQAKFASQYAAPGYVGRASGRNFDARKTPGYAPYDKLDFTVPVRTDGDVNARVWVRIREIEQSTALIRQILDDLPDGPIAVPLSPGAAPTEGLALVESFRGDVLAWVRLDGARVDRCHLRDPSWLQWPLLETAIEGNIIADFPLCNKSFNCSYSGHDL